MTANFDLSKHVFQLPEFQSAIDKAFDYFCQTPVQALPPPDSFIGCGVYALYYIGNNVLYADLARLNSNTCTRPIYAGKAVPSGWRTGRAANGDTPALSGRLREHARSIQQTANLNVEDFRCRFMILAGPESDLITSVENKLIREFVPLWNTFIGGFGNHDVGSGRHNQSPSEWDILHPGRPWVMRLTGETRKLSEEQVREKVRQALAPLRLL